jgi:tetratricopeptide (TPR) repeat protein
VKDWLSDLARLVWALFYWNARKSAFVWRGRRGPCPCHNPSDSGQPMATECEAVLAWNQPARFRRVCPLLARNDAGRWVCRVAAAEVRPFWGRAVGYIAGTALVLALAAGFGGFGFMRVVGYQVTLRQVFWPRAWSELNGVRAHLFIAQAQAHYAAGRTREALAALETATQLEPGNYQAGLMLAQLFQAGNVTAADDIYARLLREHPEHRAEISREWFRSLLGRGRLEEVATLARRQLATEPAQAAVWANALIFSAQKLGQPGWLESAAADSGVPAARSILTLAARVEQAPSAGARRTLLVQTPLIDGFPYDRVYRVTQLIREGFPRDALSLLAVSGDQLGGRDIARYTLSAYAALGDTVRLQREFGALLAPDRPLRAAELSLLALHLIQYPDPGLLAEVMAAMDRVAAEAPDRKIETYLTIFCAAGVQGDQAGMRVAEKYLVATAPVSPTAFTQTELFFLSRASAGKAQPALPLLNPFSLECTYAILDRYLMKQ